MDKKTTEKDCGCVSVNDIASELRADPRTVRKHLGIMEVDDYGRYLDSNEKVFCTRNGIERLANSFKKNKKRKTSTNIDDDDIW